MTEDERDVVASLTASPFSRQPFTEKLLIIKNGRPTPELELKEKVKKVERHFKTENEMNETKNWHFEDMMFFWKHSLDRSCVCFRCVNDSLKRMILPES